MGAFTCSSFCLIVSSCGIKTSRSRQHWIKKNYWMDLWVALQRDVAHWWHDHAIPHADKPGSPQEFWMGLVGQANQARCVWFSRLLCFSKQTLPSFEIRAGGDKRAEIIFSRDAPPLRHVADMCTKHRQRGKENGVTIWKFDRSINLMYLIGAVHLRDEISIRLLVNVTAPTVVSVLRFQIQIQIN